MSDHIPTTSQNSETGTGVRTVKFHEQIEFPIYSDPTLKRVFFRIAPDEFPLELGSKVEMVLVGWETSTVVGDGII